MHTGLRLQRWPRLLAICVAAVALWYVFSYQRDWFYFYFRQHTVVRDLAAFDSALRATGVPMEALGGVAYAGTPLPIWVLRQPATSASAPTVCVIASIHGNEPAGTEALLSLAQDLHAQPATYASRRWVLVPIANPWGWQRDLRHNGDNRDIARQFAGGPSQESEQLRQLLTKERCNVFIDLHEDRLQTGFYALAYGDAAPAQIDQVIQDVASATGTAAAKRPAHGVMHVPEADFDTIVRTTASLWARRHGVPRALIVETSDALPLANRIRIHRLAIDKFAALPSPS